MNYFFILLGLSDVELEEVRNAIINWINNRITFTFGTNDAHLMLTCANNGDGILAVA